mmetsp:Transcript_15097/g.35972  ORF Transcript_15097/g.35972 Transcript_15097/m.35972 type:complete len:221 (-) Transcript_15097:391-1053(-)
MRVVDGRDTRDRLDDVGSGGSRDPLHQHVPPGQIEDRGGLSGERLHHAHAHRSDLLPGHDDVLQNPVDALLQDEVPRAAGVLLHHQRDQPRHEDRSLLEDAVVHRDSPREQEGLPGLGVVLHWPEARRRQLEEAAQSTALHEPPRVPAEATAVDREQVEKRIDRRLGDPEARAGAQRDVDEDAGELRPLRRLALPPLVPGEPGAPRVGLRARAVRLGRAP